MPPPPITDGQVSNGWRPDVNAFLGAEILLPSGHLDYDVPASQRLQYP
ncbi:MAG: hypothetical protein FJ087_06645 [Deltaproteobacteria bacterium]|nr:hypothetical protein [Deltaproteobacteria bacterium]